MSFLRQVSAFGVAGLLAAVAHYGCLISLVEVAGWSPVPATLFGYVAGGTVSYLANRRVTFTTRRSHPEALWRFVIVAGVGFCLTWLSMSALVTWLRTPYLLAQIATTGGVMVWSYLAHKLWTFDEWAPP